MSAGITALNKRILKKVSYFSARDSNLYNLSRDTSRRTSGTPHLLAIKKAINAPIIQLIHVIIPAQNQPHMLDAKTIIGKTVTGATTIARICKKE